MRRAAVLLAALATMACGDAAQPNDPTPNAAQIDGPAEVLLAGGAKFVASATNTSGKSVVTGFTWTSSDTTILTVDGTGLAAGVRRGSVTLSATATGTTVSAKRTIPVRIATLELSVPPDTLRSVGDATPLTVVARDALNVVVASAPVTLVSDSAAVLSVSGSSAIALGEGVGRISASLDSRTASVFVVVRQRAVSLAPKPASGTVVETLTTPFAIAALDARGQPLPGTAGTWTSADALTATISSDGLATGVKPGTVTLHVTRDGLSADATLTVTAVTLSGNVQPIFTARCALSGCHVGSGAEQGMDLSAGHAVTATVNVASLEVPARKRVLPGQPDLSYLVNKVENTQVPGGSGGRMPLGAVTLSSSEIALIRAWITRGALNN